jgi:RHS repeat-associated protein
MKHRRSSWVLAGGLLVLLWANIPTVFAQGVICCNQLIDVGGGWIGASRTCDLSSLPPGQRTKLCEQLAGCAEAAPYCGVEGSCTVSGSIVDVQNQALGETIRISGTPFSLHFRSDRIQRGRSVSFPNSLAGWSFDVHHTYEIQRKILHTGEGRQRMVGSASTQAGGELRIPSEDGTVAYAFDRKGRHLRTLNSLTGTVHHRFVYDDGGRLTSIEDSYGNITRIERDAKGAPTAVVAPGGQRTTLITDAGGYLTSVTNPAGEAVRLSYSKEGRLSVLTDPKGQVHRFTYSNQGLLLKDENPAGGHWALARTQTGSGFKVALSSALGRTSTYGVEGLFTGQERRINTSPGGATIRVEQDKDGNNRVIYPDGTVSVSQFQPDPRWGKQAPLRKSRSVTTPSGLVSTLLLNRTVTLAEPNNPLSLKTLTDALSINGRTYTLTFDAGKKQASSRTPAGRQTVMTVDDQGRAVKAEVPGLLPIQFTYDKRGRLATIAQGTGAEARAMSLSYDAEGRLATIADPLKRKVKFEYDRAGRVKKQVFPAGREVIFDWDPNGNLKSLTPPGKPAHRFDYTPVNLVESYRPPQIGTAASVTTYTYNQDRQLTKLTRPDGKEIRLTYGNAGLLDTLSTPGEKYKLNFDVMTKQLASIVGPDGTLSFGYDGFLPTRTTWDGSIKGTVARGFGTDFRTASLSVSGGPAVEFKYDPDAFLTQAGALILDRDPKNGRLKGTKLGKVTTVIEHNGFGERKRFAAAFNGKEIFTVQYERDPLGRIVKLTETIQGRTDVYAYGYDRAGRLSDVTKNGMKVAHYEHDSNGNRLLYKGRLGEFKGSYDAQDRILSYGNIAFNHTANGEWLSQTVNGKTTRYDYDVLGNLRAVDLPDGTKIEYLVDGANRRIGKKVNGKMVQGFLWQSRLRPIAELDGQGNVVSRFIYATNINASEYMEKGGKTYRIITDHLGSPRLVVDVATGQVAQRMDYDEFGNVLLDTKPGFQPFGFAGGLYEPQTKLMRFGARDYDSVTGRWTAKDGLMVDTSVNLFAYVNQNPMSFIDPLGLSPQDEPEDIFWLTFGGTAVAGSGVAGITTLSGEVASTASTAYASAVTANTIPYTHQGFEAARAARFAATSAASDAAFIGPLYSGLALTGAAIAGVGIGLGINSAYEYVAGQSLGEDYADMQFDPSGRGRSFGDWYRCLWSGASGCSACPPQ